MPLDCLLPLPGFGKYFLESGARRFCIGTIPGKNHPATMIPLARTIH
jgi:hypothetical protein